MELKGRLKLIASKVQACDTLCDIGTDHAYIPIYLVLNSICKRVVATDLRKGPLMIAKENIKAFGLENLIETRLGYGLESIMDIDPDAIIIAGMGGMLICEILTRGISTAKKSSRLILQPMNAIEAVREWLYRNGFAVIDEELANEGEKIYNVIVAKWDGRKREAKGIYYHIGEKLIERRDPLLTSLICKRIKQLGKIIFALNASGKKGPINDKYTGLKDELEKILKKIKINQGEIQ
jgi:tRNA (adenine22-N1)-methyltransferase